MGMSLVANSWRTTYHQEMISLQMSGYYFNKCHQISEGWQNFISGHLNTLVEIGTETFSHVKSHLQWSFVMLLKKNKYTHICRKIVI